MTTASTVLLAVASELAKSAISNMPKMREGEKIRREWFKDGIYCRETEFNGEIFNSQYDFRQKKSRRVAVVK